ncbi:MAG: hypothetical protein HYY45_06040, partial [Deltaproteobacteria bacterium]|nr:hypothetical protein [Deltaproteobacteria bacterium]
VVLADSYLPIFAGKLARSILEQALQGKLAHLAGVAISNSSDAVRMLSKRKGVRNFLLVWSASRVTRCGRTCSQE